MKTEDKSSVKEVLPTHFKFYHDAAHGWLAVPYAAIESLSLDNQISFYSYRSKGTVYLEEDLDAVIFIKAYLKQVGKDSNDYKFFNSLVENVYDGNSSQIRNYPCYKHNEKVQLQLLPIEDARKSAA
jgi:hypothetical protein